MLDSDIKPSAILEQGPIIKKELVELPEVLNIKSQYDDKESKEVSIFLLFIFIITCINLLNKIHFFVQLKGLQIDKNKI